MNKVFLCGNLTKDMDVKIIKGKTKKDNDVIVGRFTLAVNEGYGENKKQERKGTEPKEKKKKKSGKK